MLAADRADNDGSLSLQTGLDLFTSLYGPLPGVDAAPLEETRPGDGSLAIRTVLAHWDELDPTVQDAVSAALTPSSRTETVALPGEATAIRVQSDPELTLAIEAVNLAKAAIEEKLGRPLGIPITVSVFDTRIAGDSTFADATPTRRGGLAWNEPPDGCSIRVFPTRDDTTLPTASAHEVYHCFQFTMMPDLGTVLRTPDWIAEGQAEWVGARIGGPSKATNDWFENWIGIAATSLFDLDYAAIGFYWVLESAGINPWQAMPAMIGERGPAAVAATGGDPETIWRLALTTMMRKNLSPSLDLDSMWDFSPPDVPREAFRGVATVSPTAPLTSTRPRAAYGRSGTLDVTLEGDVVHITANGGLGALAFEGGDPTVVWDGSFDQQFCLNEDGSGCSCQGEKFPQGTRQMALGLASLDPVTSTLSITTTETSEDDLLGFTDGTWEGFFLPRNSGIRLDSGTLDQTDGASSFELTVADGDVAGTFTVANDRTVDVPGQGTAEAHTEKSGELSGSPCNPSITVRQISMNGTITVSGVKVPLSINKSPTDDPVTVDWVFTQVGPDQVIGHLTSEAVPVIEAATGADFFGDLDVDFVAFRVDG